VSDGCMRGRSSVTQECTGDARRCIALRIHSPLWLRRLLLRRPPQTLRLQPHDATEGRFHEFRTVQTEENATDHPECAADLQLTLCAATVFRIIMWHNCRKSHWGSHCHPPPCAPSQTPTIDALLCCVRVRCRDGQIMCQKSTHTHTSHKIHPPHKNDNLEGRL
jgi:hypothetical protein